MRTIIVTFHNAYNFGAVLQSYALQSFIEKHFGSVEVLDYQNERILNSYKAPALAAWVKHPLSAGLKAIQTVLFKNKYAKIESFIRHRIKLTETSYTRSNVSEASSDGDVFITGSDQVWNEMLTGRDSSYLLDFCGDKTRVSYAASFGVSSIPETSKKKYKDSLSKMDFLSVREEQGAKIIKELIDKDATVLVDPTLLMSRDFWEQTSISPNVDYNYILVYKITKEENLFTFARQLSKQTGLPILFIPNNAKKLFGDKTLFSVGPEEWLGYINKASYVVTNSFHGTVFSIMFGKKFFVDLSSKNIASSRQATLLKLFGLEERIIANYSPDILDKEIDYSLVQEILTKQQKKSFEFLQQIYIRQ